MSQWAEIRHLHLMEGVPTKEIARRLKLGVKTVRRAIARPTLAVRVSPPRPRTLEPWREQIKQWLCERPRGCFASSARARCHTGASRQSRRAVATVTAAIERISQACVPEAGADPGTRPDAVGV